MMIVMFRMFVMFVFRPLGSVVLREMRPPWVGEVDVVDDVVRVVAWVVTPVFALLAHRLLLLLTTSTARAEDCERAKEIFPVHCCVITLLRYHVIRPALSVLIS